VNDAADFPPDIESESPAGPGPEATSGPPAEISVLVRQRVEARARRDWAVADSLKARIEAAGWRVVDRGDRTSVSRAAPLEVELGGQMRYGSAAAVPSRLAEPAGALWTVAVLASEEPDRASRLLAGLRAHAPAGTQVVVVLNDPSDRQAAAIAPGGPDRLPVGGREIEVVRTSSRLGYAAALNIALRRSAGELVLLADGSAWPTGDALTPLARTLEDPGVAVAGAFGIRCAEARLRPAALSLSEGGAAFALLGAWLAFRRPDLVELGPLDEHFVTPAWLDVWWSLRLRAGRAGVEAAGQGSPEEWEPAEDRGSAEPPEPAEAGISNAEAPPAEDRARVEEGALSGSNSGSRVAAELPPPRRAVRLDVPLASDGVTWPPERTRLARRNMYRVLDRFGGRTDLL
jgi:hypothetical protein